MVKAASSTVAGPLQEVEVVHGWPKFTESNRELTLSDSQVVVAGLRRSC